MIQYKTKHVTVFESALFRTTSTVIETEDLILIVDPTWLPSEVDEISHQVDAARNGKGVYLLFTHSDYDHILGFGAFQDAYTIASKAFLDNAKKEKELAAIRKFDQEYYIRRPYPMVYPRVDLAVDESTEFITVGDTRLSFWQAPGHNADGLFTLVEPLGIWIVGDYLSNEEFPFIYYSVSDYEQTLNKAEEIITGRKPTLMIPGHGDVCTDTRDMFSRLKASRDYIDALRKSAVSGEDTLQDTLWDQYDFRQVQAEYHRNNLELMKRELVNG